VNIEGARGSKNLVVYVRIHHPRPVQAVYMGESLSHLFGGPKETVETE
jgi:hypothetical protein